VLHSSKTKESKEAKKFSKELLKAVAKALHCGDDNESESESESNSDDDLESEDDQNIKLYVHMFNFINRNEMKH
jgi:hypothetical protein